MLARFKTFPNVIGKRRPDHNLKPHKLDLGISLLSFTGGTPPGLIVVILF